MPSTYPEGMPRVIDEAILHGTPVIASELEGIRRQFLEEEPILVPPKDVNALTNAIFRLIDDRCFRRDVIRNLEKRAAKKRKWKSASEQHAEFIIRTISL